MPSEKLLPLDLIPGPKSLVHIGFITGLPKSEGSDSAKAIADKFSKYPELFPHPKTITYQEISTVSLQEVFPSISPWTELSWAEAPVQVQALGIC
ncbi:hypothetical protein DSO57_1005820 [Entomophthora muscae]|uniref:Uncharacterized protein n=1 Tax=Entomophthora muscae TaxID=34485 RepID=A0ACC2TJ40_9FUNG|nr:hypothetical protein DSO57_1005820 [Entomophthora muscae]